MIEYRYRRLGHEFSFEGIVRVWRFQMVVIVSRDGVALTFLSGTG